MKFKEPLIEGRFLQRYKRFFADIEINGQTVVAHVPNTGSLKTCLAKGAPCLVSESRDPLRKLKFTLHMIKTPTSWVGIDTSWPNTLVHELWSEKSHAPWLGYDQVQREAKINDKSRMDLVMWSSKSGPPLKKFTMAAMNDRKFHFVEVKNVTYCLDGTAKFPDAVTERGQKHLYDLMKLVELGHTAELVFTLQREDFTAFSPADEIDPEYGRLLRLAKKKGVIITPLATQLSPDQAKLQTERVIPINF